MDETRSLTRPHNPWVPLAFFALAVLLVVTLIGGCVAAFVTSVPRETLEVPLTDLTLGVPRFYPQTRFGSDGAGRTLGVWLVRRADGEVLAFYSRDPHTGCQVPWRGGEAFESHEGVFHEPCGGWRYTLEGDAIFGAPPRGLDRFDTEVGDTSVTVDFERVRLGECREGVEPDVGTCSGPGAPVYRDTPPPAIAGESFR